MVVRRIAAFLAVAAVAIALVAVGGPRPGTPLWPGARYTQGDRDRAVQRGFTFLYYFACNPGNFREYGSDLLSAFYNIAETSQNLKLSRTAWSRGHELAVEWRRIHPTVPADANANDVSDLVFGHDPAARLGAPDARMGMQLRNAAARFSVDDFLLFDPVKEPPPADIPQECQKCGHQNARGATVCARCGSRLAMRNRYDVFQDALIATYTGDRAGITLGAHYADVLKWLPAMRPYPPRQQRHNAEYYAGVYTATHVVYTNNDYSQFRLSRECFPDEFEHLQTTLRHAIADKDPETMGEYLDSLRSFGLSFHDPLIREGFEFLLSVQNPDGTWGDAKDPDLYERYHPTWTSIDGLRDYRWTQVQPCPAALTTQANPGTRR
jgi:hypothetical protein